MIPASVQCSGRYLDREERYEIARLREAGEPVREIARRTGRSASTVSRELRRNVSARSGRYEPERAHTLAVARRARPKPRKLELFPQLRAKVQDRLDEMDSPQQIAGRLKLEHPDQPQMQISHEAVYQAIYLRAAGQLRREVRAHQRRWAPAELRTGRAARKPRNTRASRAGKTIAGAVSIHERPEEVADRLVPGHHEGDLIMGSVASNSAIGTVVERTTGWACQEFCVWAVAVH